MTRYSIDPDIRRARTLPGAFYRDAAAHEALGARAFARSWQWVLEPRFEAPGARPFELLPGLLGEPLVWTRDEAGATHCLSNVCTHRANVVAREAGDCNGLRCRYHGRRFALDGRLRTAPEFGEALDFPGPPDDLPRVARGALGSQHFVALDPLVDFERFVAPVRERVGALPLDDFSHDPTRSRCYTIHAHWALYVDNYLEGFHIPYVHPALARSVEYSSYATELFEWGNLQVAEPSAGEPAFDGPLSAADDGRARAAYYFWLFPNTMLNFYPWGLSVNVVEPLGIERTRVRFESFVWRPERLGQGAGGPLDEVELEDEVVVESAQRGVRSRLYRSGRYSPRREACVHHFHRLLAAALDEGQA